MNYLFFDSINKKIKGYKCYDLLENYRNYNKNNLLNIIILKIINNLLNVNRNKIIKDLKRELYENSWV